MPTTTILSTYLNPIPTWKGPLESGIPEILVISGNPPPLPPITGGGIVPFWCSQTQAKDAGIISGAKYLGTEFDDQT
jgi:hypothetical protein